MTEQQTQETIERLALMAAENGGRVYYVGGCVRDALAGRECKDIDVEVHGLTPEALEGMLDSLGERMEIGRSFGVYGLRGCGADIAMPRRETAVGRGHRDFKIEVDPFIGPKKAAERRDFTINAMMRDALTGEILDFFGGRADLEAGILRHVSDGSFAEDPLRVLRAAQFAARFGFAVAPETEALCRKIDLSALPKERVADELCKALLRSAKPSLFFDSLRRMDSLGVWFPETESLIGVGQSPVHHPEGDVWAHTMLVVNAAASLRGRAREPFGFMLAALTHDFGKAVCSEVIDGRIHSYGHETKGLPEVERFLRRLTDERALIKYVLNMTEYHMRPNLLASERAPVKSTNRMFDRSVEPSDLIALALADALGRTAPNAYAGADEFLLERYAVYREYMSRPYVTGADLIAAGLEPGPAFSDALAYSHKLRLAGIEKSSALRQTLAYARGR